MSRKLKVFSAIRWTSLGFVVKSGLQVLQISILARSLSVGDIGSLALAMSVILVAQLFNDIGISAAIIHYRNLNQDQRSSLYWLNIMTGASTMIVMYALGPVVAAFYGNDTVSNLIQIAGVAFFISSVGRQIRAEAIKNLNFDGVTKIELVAAIAGFFCMATIVLTTNRPIAAILGLIATSIVSTILFWVLLANGWRPNWHFAREHIAPFIKYGGYSTTNNFIGALNRQIDIIIGGLFINPASLGSYSLARDFTLKIGSAVNSVVTQVGFPIMADSIDHRGRLKSIYLKIISHTASVNIPMFAFMFFESDAICSIVFGNTENNIIMLLKYFALWGVLRSIMNPIGSLVLAVGRPELELKWNTFLTLVYALVFYLFSQHGAEELATLQVVLMAIFLIPHWIFFLKPLAGIGFNEFLRCVVPALFSTLLPCLYVLFFGIRVDSLVLEFLLTAFIYSALYIGASLIANRTWIFEMLDLIFKIKLRGVS